MPGLRVEAQSEPGMTAALAATAVREEVQRRWQHCSGSNERWEALVEAVEEEANVSLFKGGGPGSQIVLHQQQTWRGCS